MRMPLLLLNSPQDHVVEPAQAEYLAEQYGGPVERITLERSYHVATQDYDKELIFEVDDRVRHASRRRLMLACSSPASRAHRAARSRSARCPSTPTG